MNSQQIIKICNLILQHSLQVQKKEKILIHLIGSYNNFIGELYKQICKIGAIPFLKITPPEIQKTTVENSSRHQLLRIFDSDYQTIANMDAIITITIDNNLFEYGDIIPQKRKLYEELYYNPLERMILRKKKWLTFNYPSESYAQRAKLSYEAFVSTFIKACEFNYKELEDLCHPLKLRLLRAKTVKIIAPDTNLHFTLESNPVIVCNARHNLPDGEIFTSPNRNSAEGYIRFNAPSIYKNIDFEYIDLTFRNGNVVNVKSNNDEELLKILQIDNGAARIGEFGIGLNTALSKPLKLLPYDEKIKGSIHLALGQSYPESYNRNDSKIHWDLTKTMDNESKGQIYFDNELIQENGLFITDDLKHLNYL
ncbi:aminopeptidase [Cytobacillus firmus]|uniref:aminopeptidase n=1 Tax=Cytobacillus firmus TaxID=1399 RepID=UPI003002D6C3